MRHFRPLILAVLALSVLAPTAGLAQVKTFAVTPFTVHGPDKYQYLRQGIQSMLVSRLAWPGQLQPLDKAGPDQSPASEPEAKKTLAGLGADYLVYGGLTITGDQASLDMRVVSKEGKTWTKAVQAKLANLIPSMEKGAKDLGAEIFQRPPSPDAAKGPDGKPGKGGKGGPQNPAFVMNQNDESQPAYLNPNFRYAGAVETPGVWRSQSMPMVSSGIAVGDINGDGKNEVVILGKSTVEAFILQDRQLSPVGGKYEVSANLKLLNINIFDVNGDGKAEVIVSASLQKEPRSFILTMEGNRLTPMRKDIPLYLSVAAIPPDFSRSVVGAKGDRKALFAKGVHNVVFSQGNPQLSTKLNLPEKANPFNFVYLPEKSGYKVILVNDDDRLVTYSAKGERIAMSEEQYCGSAIGLEFDSLMAPMDQATADYLWSYYYIPLPLVTANLDRDDVYELLVSKNISLSAQFFENYRTFSQGEIHSLFWDGIGLNLQWKTRRIKGTVTGYALADVDNDGQNELVVSINTWPGATGVSVRRTVVMSYELDGSTDPKGQYGNMTDVDEPIR